MATGNPFGLLVDDDNDDLTQLIAKAPALSALAGNAPAKSQPAAKLPSKPLPPAEAVREARNEGYRGGGRGGGGGRRGGGRGGRGGFNRDFADNENASGVSNGYPRRTQEDGERLPYVARGPRHGGYGAQEERKRPFDRHSATGRGLGMKRDGSGPNNWGALGVEEKLADPWAENEVYLDRTDKLIEKEAAEIEAKEAVEEVPDVPEEKKKEPEEDKEMTLEEYQKVLEEKRKALLENKPEERVVNLDKELASMQLLSNKKGNDEIFVKLGSDKEKRKDAVEKAKKAPVNIYMKPAEGDNNYNRGGRGRGRGGRGGGRGDSGQQGNYGNHRSYAVEAPKIEDVRQFPSLGGK